MPRMNSSRVVMLGLIAGAAALFGCAKDDTILSVNVNTADGVPLISKLHIKVTQGGQVVEHDYLYNSDPTKTMLKSKTMDVGQAGMVTKVPIYDTTYQRITLPDSWSDGEATVDVQAYDEAGNPYLKTFTTKVDIRDNGATTAFVTLKEEMMMMTGGTGGTASGGAAGGGAGGAAAGASSGGSENTAGGGVGGAAAGGGAGGSGS